MAFFEKASQCLKVTVNMVLCGACAHRVGGCMVVLKDDVYWKHQNYPSPQYIPWPPLLFPHSSTLCLKCTRRDSRKLSWRCTIVCMCVPRRVGVELRAEVFLKWWKYVFLHLSCGQAGNLIPTPLISWPPCCAKDQAPDTDLSYRQSRMWAAELSYTTDFETKQHQRRED